MRTKKLFFIMATLLTLALVAAQCGGAEPAAPPKEEAPKEEPAPEKEEPAEEPAKEEAKPASDALPDLAGRDITIAIENAYLPFNYISLETGEPGGWDYDAWDEICNRLNCVPVYQEVAWDGMIAAVGQGQYDAAADGITITDERAEVVDFSDGYITIDQRLLTRKDE
ncbi:transporter substrate-binding domain-containing protein, partial [Anaerolineales bacterium HSG6]|nr:transporter substrate-binding domain-containing protein [Anaerolineales bacterium HSG6]